MTILFVEWDMFAFKTLVEVSVSDPIVLDVFIWIEGAILDIDSHVDFDVDLDGIDLDWIKFDVNRFVVEDVELIGTNVEDGSCISSKQLFFNL